MESVDYLRFVSALALVVGLIFALTWAIRRFAPLGLGAMASGKRRLAVIDSLALDAKHRIILLRHDDQEHLLLLGGPSSVIASRPMAVAQSEDRT